MSNIITDLLEVLYERIGQAHPRVYFEEVPEKDPATGKAVRFPYICYKLPNSIKRELPEEFTLEVDCWDNKGDTTRLELLAAAVDDMLHCWCRLFNGFGLRVFRLNRLQVPDPDPKIRRRLLRYLVRVYFINQKGVVKS